MIILFSMFGSIFPHISVSKLYIPYIITSSEWILIVINAERNVQAIRRHWSNIFTWYHVFQIHLSRRLICNIFIGVLLFDTKKQILLLISIKNLERIGGGPDIAK